MRLQEVLALATRKFWEQETYELHGKTLPNTYFDAAGDAVLEAASTLEKAAALCIEAGKRRDLRLTLQILDGSDESTTMLEYLQFVLGRIVGELMSQEKTIAAEDKRRFSKYDN